MSEDDKDDKDIEKENEEEPKAFGPERILDQDIEDELKTSYLTYAMSVIVSRALPDVRDGLKPSQRRILVAMQDLNLGPSSQHVKCAAIVGECMKKYHPHGDSAIYPTLVRMAQDFNIRYPLVDGQGNFGSIDGDPPAAMRYTEARMTQATTDLMADLDLDTVEMARNFDDRYDEPTVLPSRLPNLILNGSTGIAVGMATSMPPHNVREVCQAIVALIGKPEITIDELMQHIPAPDFPTGAYICGRAGIRKAYHTGRGIITLRSKYHIDQGRTKTSIIVTEIPYQESKETLINRIVDAIKAGSVTGISDVRDESDKKIRLVIELKRDADEEVVINQLFKHTPLQSSFSIINIALVNGRPETLNLKDLLNEFKKHRMVVIRRRTRHLLRKAEARLHLVEGLLLALDHIDEIIALIRGSATVEVAHDGLMARFTFSDVQAREILQMRLQRLTALERNKLIDEKKKLEGEIEDLRAILASERRVLDIIVTDLQEIQERYGDARRTEIIDEVGDIDREALITEEKVVVTFSREGYVKRTPLNTYRSQGRGGRGISGGSTKSGDFIKDLFIASTHDYILLFTTRGRIYWLKVYDIPDLDRTARGRALINMVKLEPDEQVNSVLFVDQFDEERQVLLATRRGVIKKTALTQFSNPKKSGIIAITLDEGDNLIGAGLTRSGQEVILGTRNGMAIRFDQAEVRSTGRGARGVGGIQLKGDDEVVDMVTVLAPPTPPEGTPAVELPPFQVGPAAPTSPASTEGSVSPREAPAAPPASGEAAAGHAEEGEEEPQPVATPWGPTLLTVCEHGYGKRTSIGEYRLQGRNGSGIINIKTSDRNGKVVALKAVTNEDDIVMITSQGLVMRTKVADIRTIGRATQGVRLIKLRDDDRLVSVERVVGGEREDPPADSEETVEGTPPAEGETPGAMPPSEPEGPEAGPGEPEGSGETHDG
jgi:DNA gyrase subunit A